MESMTQLQEELYFDFEFKNALKALYSVTTEFS